MKEIESKYNHSNVDSEDLTLPDSYDHNVDELLGDSLLQVFVPKSREVLPEGLISFIKIIEWLYRMLGRTNNIESHTMLREFLNTHDSVECAPSQSYTNTMEKLNRFEKLGITFSERMKCTIIIARLSQDLWSNALLGLNNGNVYNVMDDTEVLLEQLTRMWPNLKTQIPKVKAELKSKDKSTDSRPGADVALSAAAKRPCPNCDKQGHKASDCTKDKAKCPCGLSGLERKDGSFTPGHMRKHCNHNGKPQPLPKYAKAYKAKDDADASTSA